VFQDHFHEPLKVYVETVFLFDLLFAFILYFTRSLVLRTLAFTLFTSVGARSHVLGVFKIFILTTAGDFRLLGLYSLSCVVCDVRRYGVAPSVEPN
jgi:hypothetical protein